MLQPAATSTQSSLALTAGAPGVAAENPDIPEGFAALLALGMNVEGDAAAKPAAELTDLTAAIRQIGTATGNLSGKSGGKILPVALPKAEAATAGLEIRPAKPGEATEEPAAANELAAQPISVSLTLPVPVPAAAVTAQPAAQTSERQIPPHAAIPQPVSVQAQLGTAAPRPLGTSSKLLATTAINVVPQPSAEPAEAPTVQTTDAAIQTATPRSATSLIQPRTAMQLPLAATPSPALDTAVAAPLVQPAMTPIPTTGMKPAAAPARPAGQPAVQLVIDMPGSGDASQPVLSATMAIQLSTSLPAAAQPAKVKAAAPAQPASPSEKTPAAVTAAPLLTAAATTTSAAAAPIVAAPTVAATLAPAQGPPANPAPAVAGTRSEPADTVKPASSPAASTGDFTAVIDQAKPIAAELQPMLAMRDAQPAVQMTVNAPVTAPAAAPQSGHDFAALVDRLVEARDAVMPQSIRAAIHHAEFGQVALNFKTEDARLTVSMTSADPEFAPAVQAAAAMQANTQAGSQSDNGPANQRQESQQNQQNSAGSATTGQSQAQAQSQSQGSARGSASDRGETQRQTNTSARTDEDKKSGERGGIYA